MTIIICHLERSERSFRAEPQLNEGGPDDEMTGKIFNEPDRGRSLCYCWAPPQAQAQQKELPEISMMTAVPNFAFGRSGLPSS